MNKIILIVLSMFLIACDAEPGTSDSVLKTTCIDGVKYVYFKSGSGNRGYGYLSVKFNREGKVELCDTYAMPPQ